MAATRQASSPTFGGMNPSQWGVLGGGVGAGLASLFGGQPDFQNPAEAAMPYLNRIPESLRPYFQPYIEQGQRAGGALEGQYNAMTANPSQFLSNLSQGYQQSPGYQFKLNQALQEGNNAAAAGGMLGSPAHQQQNEATSEGLANRDYEDWLNHVLGIFGGGQQGLQGFQNQGYGASTGYGENLANALMSQASFAGQGAAEQNKYNQAQSAANSGAWGSLAGLAGQALPFLSGL